MLPDPQHEIARSTVDALLARAPGDDVVQLTAAMAYSEIDQHAALCRAVDALPTLNKEQLDASINAGFAVQDLLRARAEARDALAEDNAADSDRVASGISTICGLFNDDSRQLTDYLTSRNIPQDHNEDRLVRWMGDLKSVNHAAMHDLVDRLDRTPLLPQNARLVAIAHASIEAHKSTQTAVSALPPLTERQMQRMESHLHRLNYAELHRASYVTLRDISTHSHAPGATVTTKQLTAVAGTFTEDLTWQRAELAARRQHEVINRMISETVAQLAEQGRRQSTGGEHTQQHTPGPRQRH